MPYDNAVTLFYSDIDPAFNAAVAAGTLTTAIDRHPTWFLVNGEPYVGGATPTPDITSGANGSWWRARTSCCASPAPPPTPTWSVLQGLNMTIHAEDGQQYNYQEGDTSSPRRRGCSTRPCCHRPRPRTPSSVATAAGRYAVYDGDGYMTNPSDPADEAVGDNVGGMLRFLAVEGGSGPRRCRRQRGQLPGGSNPDQADPDVDGDR